ncbi:MAG: pyridoxamine 5'-phosphate oxidase family protein [Deltaproteobacteria bacterium]|nr:pyridoxamine 5'-phosphate oxidase family protein [Deltaproteobacteria bacterium]
MSAQRVREIVADAPYGILATLDGEQPRLRPMAFVLTADGRLWSSTYRSSGKVREMEKNPRVEVCFVDRKRCHARFEGRADLGGGPDKKERLLEINPKVRRHFASGQDEHFVHIEITPTRVEWTEPGFGEYHLVDW